MRTRGFACAAAAAAILVGAAGGIDAPIHRTAAAGVAPSDPYPLRAEVRERFALEPGATVKIVGSRP